MMMGNNSKYYEMYISFFFESRGEETYFEPFYHCNQIANLNSTKVGNFIMTIDFFFLYKIHAVISISFDVWMMITIIIEKEITLFPFSVIVLAFTRRYHFGKSDIENSTTMSFALSEAQYYHFNLGYYFIINEISQHCATFLW